MSQPVPAKIGKYSIASVLGHGAMGVVYKGFDPHINRPVAIKTIHKDLLGGPDAVDSIAARFRNEAQAVGRIAHPGVVAIYELGEDANTAFIAMEFVEGRNLDQVLGGTPLLAEAQMLSIMDQLLDALDAAHRHGVWHRDIKPANLLLTADGKLKLTDFGIARIENAGLTQVSSMIGTPGYMSPEQYVGEGIDQRADLFAAGVVLYRLLAGRPPFAGSAEQVMYKILNEDPPPPSKVNPQRPAAYDRVVASALAKRTDQRFPSAAAFRHALSSAAAQPGSAGNDATVIVPQGQWSHTVAAAATPVAPVAPTPSQRQALQGSSAAAPITGWDQPTLTRIERALASHVGPMAKLMVRDAARSCTDVLSLATACAQHIGEAAKRQQFIDAATHGSQARPTQLGSAAKSIHPPLPSSAGSYPPTQIAAEPLTDEFRAHASQVLTRLMGPIAKIVVKRAAEQARGKADFIDRLVAGAPDVDAAVLRRDLG